MDLPVGYTAIRWTAETVSIPSLPWANLIVKVITRNSNTGMGYVEYDPANQFPTMSLFAQGVDYLVNMRTAVTITGAEPSPVGAFQAFDGYTPPTTSTTPTVAGNTQAALADVLLGRLVARMPNGVVHYSALNLDHRQRFAGIALNSALAGGSVQVQRVGTVTISGLSFGAPNDVLFAGADGQLVPNSATDMAFHHIVGRVLTSGSIFLNPQTTYSL